MPVHRLVGVGVLGLHRLADLLIHLPYLEDLRALPLFGVTGPLADVSMDAGRPAREAAGNRLDCSLLSLRRFPAEVKLSRAQGAHS
jgi:hypothetical protein